VVGLAQEHLTLLHQEYMTVALSQICEEQYGGCEILFRLMLKYLIKNYPFLLKKIPELRNTEL